MVDRVEEFAAELQFAFFAQRKILRHAGVKTDRTRPSQNTLANVSEGPIPYVAAAGVLGSGKRRGIEPRYAVDGACAHGGAANRLSGNEVCAIGAQCSQG